MSKCFIEGTGGAAKLFAAIGVTYPAGSVVACTNGTKTLKAKTTTGQWIFAIPEPDTWTVTATDITSGKSKSKSVSIIAEGQFEVVELRYDLAILSTTSGLMEGYGISGTYISPTIDVTDYTILEVSAKLTWAAYTTDVRVGLSSLPDVSPTNPPAAFLSFGDVLEAKTLDISSLTGFMHLGFFGGSSFADFSSISEDANMLNLSSGAATGEVYNIILK